MPAFEEGTIKFHHTLMHPFSVPKCFAGVHPLLAISYTVTTPADTAEATTYFSADPQAILEETKCLNSQAYRTLCSNETVGPVTTRLIALDFGAETLDKLVTALEISRIQELCSQEIWQYICSAVLKDHDVRYLSNFLDKFFLLNNENYFSAEEANNITKNVNVIKRIDGQLLCDLVESMSSCSALKLLKCGVLNSEKILNFLGLEGVGVQQFLQLATVLDNDAFLSHYTTDSEAAEKEMKWMAQQIINGRPSEWRPQNHHRFPAGYRAATRTLRILSGARQKAPERNSRPRQFLNS